MHVYLGQVEVIVPVESRRYFKGIFCFNPFLQVRLMITDAARHKLLVLTGQSFENTGELILQSGSFSFQNFIEIFTDQEVCISLLSILMSSSILVICTFNL